MGKVEATQRDIVCGMMIDTAAAAGRRQISGNTYYFCSSQCLAAFDRRPASFLPSTPDDTGAPARDIKR
jgi:YHS domain-containing protein